MKTIVTIHANVDSSKQAKVTINKKNRKELECFFLNNREIADRFVYDDIEIVISEEDK
jgi:hypothetical protein